MAALERVFIDIDTQVDFMDPAGKLYVPGADLIVGTLERLLAYAARTRTPVLSSVDEHTPDDSEFKDWPPHCVRGTPGQAKIPATLMPNSLVLPPEQTVSETILNMLLEYDQLIFPKATLDAFDNASFAELVRRLDVDRYVVFGVATDICVRLAARGLLECGCRVQVVEDAVRAITPEAGERTRRELTGLGAEWVRTADIVGEPA
jgi:nicotinamidase/pyrazinamidase